MRGIAVSQIKALSALACASLLAAAGFSGCQQLFTTSLGKSLARHSLPIPSKLDAGQAADLASEAKANNDTKLAGALVASLVSQIAQTSDPTLKEELKASAASAAIVASGVSSAMTDLIAEYSSNPSEPPTAQSVISLVSAIKAGANSSVAAALSYLDPKSGIKSETASANGLGATDYAIAAVVVAAPVLPADPTAMTPAEVTTFQATTEGQSAIRIVNQASALSASDPNSTGLLNSLMGNFNLPTTP